MFSPNIAKVAEEEEERKKYNGQFLAQDGKSTQGTVAIVDADER